MSTHCAELLRFRALSDTPLRSVRNDKQIRPGQSRVLCLLIQILSTNYLTSSTLSRAHRARFARTANWTQGGPALFSSQFPRVRRQARCRTIASHTQPASTPPATENAGRQQGQLLLQRGRYPALHAWPPQSRPASSPPPRGADCSPCQYRDYEPGAKCKQSRNYSVQKEYRHKDATIASGLAMREGAWQPNS